MPVHDNECGFVGKEGRFGEGELNWEKFLGLREGRLNHRKGGNFRPARAIVPIVVGNLLCVYPNNMFLLPE